MLAFLDPFDASNKARLHGSFQVQAGSCRTCQAALHILPLYGECDVHVHELQSSWGSSVVALQVICILGGAPNIYKDAAVISAAMYLQGTSHTRKGLQARQLTCDPSHRRAHALTVRQPQTGLDHTCHQIRCRKTGVSSWAILRVFQQKNKTKIVRSGTPVLRKVPSLHGVLPALKGPSQYEDCSVHDTSGT